MEVAQVVDARKNRMQRTEALDLAKKARDLYAAKGKKVIHLDLAKSDSDTVAGALLGPTGNLRAPTMRIGKTLLVGFEPDTYDKVLGA